MVCPPSRAVADLLSHSPTSLLPSGSAAQAGHLSNRALPLSHGFQCGSLSTFAWWECVLWASVPVPWSLPLLRVPRASRARCLCAGSRAFPRRRCSHETGHQVSGEAGPLQPALPLAHGYGTLEKSGLLGASPAASAKRGGYGSHCHLWGCRKGRRHFGGTALPTSCPPPPSSLFAAQSTARPF